MDVAAAREAWAAAAPALRPDDLVFVDERGITTNMARAYPVAALDAALATLVDAITADDAHGYFRHCGYGR